MVFLDVGVLALALGKLLGGSFANLGSTRIRGTWLAFVAIALQLAAFPSQLLPWNTPAGAAKGLWLVSYAFLVAMLVWNRRLPGVVVIAAGVGCNLFAILANGGLMPVRQSALAAAGRHYRIHDNSILLAHPHAALLIDRWAVPSWLPLGNVFSVGDVLIALGTLVTIVLAMRATAGAEVLANRESLTGIASSIPTAGEETTLA
jgi:hypothetical protein